MSCDNGGWSGKGHASVLMKTAYLLVKVVIGVLLSSWMAVHTTASAASPELISNVSILEQQQFDANHLHLTIGLGNRRETLVLTDSPAFHRVNTIDQLGRRTATTTRAYAGSVDNVPGSWARVTITDNDIDGVIDTGTSRVFITSKAATAPERQIRQFQHAVDKIITAPATRRHPREVVQIPVGSGFENSADGVTRVAKIAIVVDSFYNEALGGRGLAEAISTINTVDGLYQQEFGLALKVDTAIIITDRETLDLGQTSLEDNLERFRNYRLTAAELPAELALVHLFTGVRTDDPSVGLAYIDSACREDGYDVSLSTPFEYPVLLTAHEIGHNLGAAHDDETALCRLSEDFLMHSQISKVTTNQFSVCSRNTIASHLDNSACYFSAIDLSLTLTRTGDNSIIAIITNTDSEKAFPSAELIIKLKNASIASAPASCNIDNITEVSCIIPTTLPGENQALEFAFRFDENAESTIDATLEAVGFVDTKTINNYAQIIAPADSDPDDTLTIAGNDPTTPTTTGAGGDAVSGSAGGGGGVLGGLLWMLILPGYRLATQRESRTRG